MQIDVHTDNVGDRKQWPGYRSPQDPSIAEAAELER